MNKQKFITLNGLCVLIILLFAQNIFAANFNITPLGTLPTSVTTGHTVFANYTLTNMTHTARNGYVLQGLPATVTQNSTNPYCSNPINLGPTASCQLQLNITGAVSSNFAICKENNCTTAASPLNVSQSTGPSAPHFAYITNDYGNNSPYVSLCVLNPTTGSIVSCQNAGGDSVLSTANGLGGIVLNNSETIAYISNSYGASNTVFQCTINQITKEFSACTSITLTSAPLYAPLDGGLTLNNTETTAFLVNDTNGEVYACPIISGTITDNCVNTNGSFPNAAQLTQINLNQDSSVAYIGSISNNGVIKCNVSGTNFSSCTNISGDGIISFNQPSGVALTNTGSKIYVADNGNNNIYICSTSMSGSNFTSCSIAYPNLTTSPWTITLNANNTIAYITNDVDTTYTCTISDIDGSLSNCLASTAALVPSDTALFY
jgi:hypothetical protein